MELRVIGCHGGETPRHRTSAFLLDDQIAIDAGSLTSGMTLAEQWALKACIVSHAHLDHIRDLATIADNRVQKGCEPLIVAGTKPTLKMLQRHFFNNRLWPDFTRIPSESNPTIRLLPLKPEVPVDLFGYTVRPILVSHAIECCAFIVERNSTVLAYSGDTGPTTRLWEVLNELPTLNALMLEVSFPNEQQHLATSSGHHTPQSASLDLQKHKNPRELPTLVYHIKPAFQSIVESECAKLKGLNLSMLRIGDRFIL